MSFTMTPTLSSPRKVLLPLAFSILWLSCSAFFSPLLPSCRQRSSPRQITSKQNPTINENTSALFSNIDDDDDDRSRPNIIKIQTHQDYVNFLEEDDRICLVKFYASWCKSCKRFGVSFRHLAFEEGDHLNPNGDVVHSGKVRFAEVEYSANAHLCKTLKVRKLPTVHYYKRGGGKLSELTCKPSQFQLVVDEMNLLLDGNAAAADEVEIIATKEVDDGGEITVPSNILNDGSNNVTSSSFDEAVSNLSQEIMKKIQINQTATTERQEKNSWFRF